MVSAATAAAVSASISTPVCAVVSALARTKARAVARRRSGGLAPTSTIRTPPASSTWVSALFPGISDGKSSAAVACGGLQIGELARDPRGDVVLVHLPPNPLDPPSPLGRRQLERAVQRFGLPGHVERVDGQSPLSEL